MRVHVALGSNLGDRVARLEAACAAMRELARDGELERSPLYESAPVGPSDQPDYVNGACTFVTALEPEPLLAELQRIEADGGRVRPAARWSARTLDLDLLLCGERIVQHARPDRADPAIAERAFVLRPLADLDPALEVPGLGTVSALLAALGETGLRPL